MVPWGQMRSFWGSSGRRAWIAAAMWACACAGGNVTEGPFLTGLLPDTDTGGEQTGGADRSQRGRLGDLGRLDRRDRGELGRRHQRSLGRPDQQRLRRVHPGRRGVRRRGQRLRRQADEGDPRLRRRVRHRHVRRVRRGTMVCEGGSLSCMPDATAQAEVCDGLDNDCDGTPSTTATPAGAGPATPGCSGSAPPGPRPAWAAA